MGFLLVSDFGRSATITMRREGLKKMVIKVSVDNQKKRSKALKLVFSVSGVEYAAITGEEEDELEVLGDTVDPIKLCRLLRKRLGPAFFVSVGRVGDKFSVKKDVATVRPNNERLLSLPNDVTGEGSSLSLTTINEEEGQPSNETQSISLFHDDQIVELESSSGGDDWIDLRFANKLCHCGHKAAIRIVESENPIKGRLYYGCTSNGCQMLEWCNPHTTKLMPYGRPLNVVSKENESNAAMAELFEAEKNEHAATARMNAMEAKQIESNAAMTEVFEAEENEHAATARMNVMEAKQIEYAAMIKVLQGNQALMKLVVTVFLLFAGLCFMLSIVVILMK